jgi:hypothetical protein
MTTSRAQVAAKAHSYLGVATGHGYDNANPFSADLGRPTESWCFDFVTDVFKRSGLPLPSMQPGCKTGAAYVPDGWNIAKARGATKPSWLGLPADLGIFDWNGDGVPDHIEMVFRWSGGVLVTDGGNSGPGGGVHEHEWSDPEGRGNPVIMGVIDTSRFVSFGATPLPPRPPVKPPITSPHRLLMLKSPWMTGSDVGQVQTALNHRYGARLRVDDTFGVQTRAAVLGFERRTWPHDPHQWDGIVGPMVRRALGLPY